MKRPPAIQAEAQPDRSWEVCSADDAVFCDEGVANPTAISPIVECLGSVNSVVGEAVRLLGAAVLALDRQRGARCFALSSALPGEGKSTVSVGLACALATEPQRRTLLVETDFRRPSLTPMLNLSSAPGLGEWLNGDLDYLPVRLVEPGGFYLLVAGETGHRPEVLGSRKMGALLRASRGLFDFVLLDAPPVLPVADTVLIQHLVDGFLLVVRSRRTPREALLEALGRLDSDRVVGVVMNDHQEYRGSYHSHARRTYGMDSPRESSARR